MLQEELARRAGLSPSALSNFEQGRRRTSFVWLKRISKALGVKVSDLIPDSRARRRLAETKEEEKLLQNWRKIGSDVLREQLLEVIETTFLSGGRTQPLVFSRNYPLSPKGRGRATISGNHE